VDPQRLAAALSCPSVFTHLESHEPVLLVHGTAVTPEEHWGFNYVPYLREAGFDECTVRLPDRALGDIQVTSEYVVYALRFMARRTGALAEPAHARKIDVVGHSQGALQPRWALKFWPSLRDIVDDYVGMSGPNHGDVYANAGCSGGSCIPAWWQYSIGSRFLAALNRGDETPGEVSYTTVWSQNDNLVQPYTSPPLKDASNVMIQDLCPGRPVEHLGTVSDAVAFAVVMDALTHHGPAKPSRFFRPELCAETYMPGVDPVSASSGAALAYWNAVTAIQFHGKTDHEPPLKWYAR
jgi:hypothetical protein